MEWIEIDSENEKANVPEVKQEVLCFSESSFKMFYTVAEYTGFWTWSDQPKRHYFYVEDGCAGSHILPTHWMILPEPPNGYD